MSKGTRIMPVRFPDELAAEVFRELSLSERTREGEPWTFSDFVRLAVAEKIAHRKRSRAKRARKKTTPPAGSPTWDRTLPP
jgi:hypothetical protein